MQKPVIGITLDSEESGEYSPFPYYALRQNYFASLEAQGAVPLGLSYGLELVEQYVEMIDGLLLTGGNFDISPSMYGDDSQHETVILKDARTKFEYAIMQRCLEVKKPILGICGGEQLINVVLGGTLIQHIPDAIENALEHEVKERTAPAHDVVISEGTLLHSIVGKTTFGVNTSHHQAVLEPAPGVVVNAVSPQDKVIEGIEYPDHPFCLGVQWHPEYEVSEADTAILAAFVVAAKKIRGSAVSKPRQP